MRMVCLAIFTADDVNRATVAFSCTCNLAWNGFGETKELTADPRADPHLSSLFQPLQLLGPL